MSYLGLPFGHHCQIDIPYLHSKTEVAKAAAFKCAGQSKTHQAGI
jgi:hypothetical protein